MIRKPILVIAFVFTVLMCTTISARSLEFVIGSKTLGVASPMISTYELNSPPFIENGRTMVPVRIIAENFGADVKWVAEERAVFIAYGDTSILLPIGSTTAKVNGVDVSLDVPASIASARTFVPLRFVTETLGYKVRYIDPLKVIYITDNPALMTIDGNDLYIDDYVAFLMLAGKPFEELDPNSMISAITETIKGITSLANRFDSENKVLANIEEHNQSFFPVLEELRQTSLVSTLYNMSLTLLKSDAYIVENFELYTDSDAVTNYILEEALIARAVMHKTVDEIISSFEAN